MKKAVKRIVIIGMLLGLIFGVLNSMNVLGPKNDTYVYADGHCVDTENDGDTWNA